MDIRINRGKKLTAEFFFRENSSIGYQAEWTSHALVGSCLYFVLWLRIFISIHFAVLVFCCWTKFISRLSACASIWRKTNPNWIKTEMNTRVAYLIYVIVFPSFHSVQLISSPFLHFVIFFIIRVCINTIWTWRETFLDVKEWPKRNEMAKRKQEKQFEKQFSRFKFVKWKSSDFFLFIWNACKKRVLKFAFHDNSSHIITNFFYSDFLFVANMTKESINAIQCRGRSLATDKQFVRIPKSSSKLK